MVSVKQTFLTDTTYHEKAIERTAVAVRQRTIPRVIRRQVKNLRRTSPPQYRLNLCRLAFGYYDRLPGPFRKFVGAYLKHDRELYIDYLLNSTPLGKLRYTLHNPELFFLYYTYLKMPTTEAASCTIN